MSMYYKRNSFEEPIPTDELEPGMRVCVPRSVTYGWNQNTGLTIYKLRTIKRVTPKKTKVICEDGSEYFAKETIFLRPVHEMNIENDRAGCFFQICKTVSDLGRQPIINYVGSYEDMKEAAKQLAAFYEFCLRNAKEK